MKPIESTDPFSPDIVYDPHIENVANLEITISRTRDNSLPPMVQLGIFGCPQPPMIGTKTQVETTKITGISSPATAQISTAPAGSTTEISSLDTTSYN
jgi:hypothetical protein